MIGLDWTELQWVGLVELEFEWFGFSWKLSGLESIGLYFLIGLYF